MTTERPVEIIELAVGLRAIIILRSDAKPAAPPPAPPTEAQLAADRARRRARGAERSRHLYDGLER